MDFVDDSYYFLLAVPAGLVVLYVFYWRWKRSTMARVGDETLLEAMSQSRSARADVAAFSLVALAIALLVVALAGPRWGDKKEEVTRRGVDVVFAVDISRSMEAEDVPPSRLRAARAEINRTLSLLDGDRVGLVGFAGIAYAQCPLTTDYGAVRTFLDLLDPQIMPVQGTAIGRAINESVHLLTGWRESMREGDDDETEDINSSSRGRDQVIVIFTDGEDHETDPASAAAAAQTRGIRVYTVPIGTAEGAEIPVFDHTGERVRSLTDRNGEVVISRVNAESLDAVAREGNGMVIPYEGEGSVATVIDREIDRMQSAEVADILRPETEERFYFFLAPALVLLLVAMALSDRKRGAPHVGWLAGLLLALSLPGLGGCEDTFVYESDEVAEGLAQTAGGETAEGLEAIRAFRAELPAEELLDPKALDYDQAVALLRDDQLDEARRLFLVAIGSPSREVQFRSHYNVGNIEFIQEDYDEALSRYRRALALRPDDEDAKWNLEVTLRRLFPPCVTFEDPFEDNDGPDMASPLELPPGAGAAPGPGPGQPPGEPDETIEPERVLCGADADWYRIEGAQAGARVSATVTFERLRDDTGGAELPHEIPADAVWITLVAGDGTTVLDTDAGQLDIEAGNELIDAEALTRELRHVEIDPGASPEGVVYLAIDANLGLEYRYDVEVTVTPPCEAAEDPMEDNDSREMARPLEPGDHQLVACPNDADWFRVPVELGDTVFVDIQAGPDEGLAALEAREAAGDSGSNEEEHSVPLNVALYRAGQDEPIDVNWGRDGLLELAAYDIAEPGELLISVESMVPSSQGAYLLQLKRFAPCIVGDDPFEENDAVETARPVDPSQGPQRHLRLCDADDDWFQVPVTEGEHLSVAVEWVETERSVRLAMTEPGTTTVVAYGTPVELPEPLAREPGELTPPTPRARMQRSVHLEEPEQSAPYNIRVSGDPGFYNLVFPDPNEDQSCDNPQESDENDESDSDQQDENEQQDDNDQQQSDQEQQSDDQQEQGDEQQDEPQEPQDEQAQADPEVDPNSELADEMTEEEAERERLRQRLESLAAEQDRNLQLERALENIAPIQVERQW